MQVAKQNMPLSSIVIGVDLFPIKQIPGCIGLVEDITTEKCKQALTKELQNWKVDVVLNDGAPNVGKNWQHDAFHQVTLTLSALKLATGFLKPGGWFVTKVFRSKDYNALMWVLKQLFKKVHATKPSASRKESAEIFVVCQHYLAPDRIDAKLLDPKYVFEDLEMESQTKVNLLHPEKQKKLKPEGYTEADFKMRNEMNVSEFIANSSGITALQGISALVFDTEELLKHPRTTVEIRECCKDLKVLGRKDLKGLLNYWRLMRKELIEDKEQEEKEEEEPKRPLTQEELEDQEDAEIQKQIADAEMEDAKEAKRKRKHASKLRAKLNEKLNLKMVLKGDEGPREEADDEVFALKGIKGGKQLTALEDQAPDQLADSDEEEDAESKGPKLKVARVSREKMILDDHGNVGTIDDLYSGGESSDNESDLDKQGMGFSDSEDDLNSDDEMTGVKPPNLVPSKKQAAKVAKKNPLIDDLDHRDKDAKRQQRVQMWFEKDTLKDIGEADEEDMDLDKLQSDYRRKGVKVLGEAAEKLADDLPLGKKAQRRAKHKATDEGFASESSDDSDSEPDNLGMGDDSDDEEEGVAKQKLSILKKGGKGGFDVVAKETVKKAKVTKLTEEELALGALLVSSKKTRRDMVDAAWNRYAFNDTNLPEWFEKDEANHMRKPVPVPKELQAEYHKKMQEINIRPIKKVMEAKARKKRRALKRLDKAKKKAAQVMDNQDASSQEKIRQIKKLYRGAEDKKKEVKYVVAKRANAAKRATRPAGLKGRYKMVDKRMKTETRAAKARDRRSKKR